MARRVRVSSRLFGIVRGGAKFPIDEAHGDEEGADPWEPFTPFVRIGLFDILWVCGFVFSGMILRSRCLIFCSDGGFGFLNYPTKVAAWVVEEKEVVGVE
jgi:hypothetical protein